MALKKNYFKKHTNSPIKLHHGTNNVNNEIDPEKINKKKVILEQPRQTVVESTAVRRPQFGTPKDTNYFNANEASDNLLSILNNTVNNETNPYFRRGLGVAPKYPTKENKAGEAVHQVVGNNYGATYTRPEPVDFSNMTPEQKLELYYKNIDEAKYKQVATNEYLGFGGMGSTQEGMELAQDMLTPGTDLSYNTLLKKYGKKRADYAIDHIKNNDTYKGEKDNAQGIFDSITANKKKAIDWFTNPITQERMLGNSDTEGQAQFTGSNYKTSGNLENFYESSNVNAPGYTYSQADLDASINQMSKLPVMPALQKPMAWTSDILELINSGSSNSNQGVAEAVVLRKGAKANGRPIGAIFNPGVNNRGKHTGPSGSTVQHELTHPDIGLAMFSSLNNILNDGKISKDSMYHDDPAELYPNFHELRVDMDMFPGEQFDLKKLNERIKTLGNDGRNFIKKYGKEKIIKALNTIASTKDQSKSSIMKDKNINSLFSPGQGGKFTMNA
tara:strand:- start:35 stop:1537 length:1503 start_codon:yes stop_codon:yes gene_type:complete